MLASASVGLWHHCLPVLTVTASVGLTPGYWRGLLLSGAPLVVAVDKPLMLTWTKLEWGDGGGEGGEREGSSCAVISMDLKKQLIGLEEANWIGLPRSMCDFRSWDNDWTGSEGGHTVLSLCYMCTNSPHSGAITALSCPSVVLQPGYKQW